MSSRLVKEPKRAKLIHTFRYARKHVTIAIHRREIRMRNSPT